MPWSLGTGCAPGADRAVVGLIAARCAICGGRFLLCLDRCCCCPRRRSRVFLAGRRRVRRGRRVRGTGSAVTKAVRLRRGGGIGGLCRRGQGCSSVDGALLRGREMKRSGGRDCRPVAATSRAADADPVRSCAMRARAQAAKSRIGWMRTTAVDPEAEGLTASFPANRTWSSGKPRTTVQAAAYFYPWRELCEHTAPLCSLQGWLAPARRGLCAPRPS